MAKIFTISVRPWVEGRKARHEDPRYVEGQRLIVDAMRYLTQEDPQGNRLAVELLSEHFRTRFRMSDKPPAP